jgi:predicted acyltransferase (DUF342 family)
MSWKQYGGIKNLDSYNNVSVNNIIADKITVRDKFLTEFQIIGETQLLGDVILGDTSLNLIKFKSDVIADRNIDILGDLNVNGKLIITSSGEGFFLQGTDDNRLGINVENPLAVLDIAGSYESVLNVYSDQSNNRNIIARNYLQNGIAVNVTDDDSSSLQFYSGTDISNNKEFPDSEIKYLNGGILEIITGQDTRILSQVSISADGSKGHIHNETMVVYDISNGTYKNLYYKDDTIIKGNAFSLIAYDSSANTSMNITTPDGNGAVISGGAYPKDTARSMLTLDVSNNSEEKPQALMIVSGQKTEKYNTTTSINKYISQTDQYSLDVNGATYIADSQINIQEERNMRFLKVAAYGTHVLAAGSYDTDVSKLDVYESKDSGISWGSIIALYIVDNDAFSTNQITIVKDIFMNDRVRCIITEDASPAMFVSTNTNPTGLGDFGTYVSVSLATNSVDSSTQCNSIYSFYENTNNHFITARNEKLDIFTIALTGNSTIPKNIGFLINDVKGVGNIIYAVGTYGNIKSYTLNTSMNANAYINPTTIFTERTYASYNDHPNKHYKRVFVYDSNNIIAIGDGIITYTHDGGLNWNSETSVVSDISLNDIHIKSVNEAIIVGDNGKIFVSHDAYRTWKQLDNNYINGSGTSEYLTGDTSNNITSITMTNDNNNIITTHALTTSPDTGRLLLTYAPSVLNRDKMSTLDVIGSLNVSGDLVLHDRGELKTTDVSFGLLKTNTRQIDFGLSGELINIGAETGLVDMKGRLQVAMDVSLNSNLDVQGETVLHGFLDVSNSAHIKEELTVDGSLNVTEIYGINNETITMSRPTGLVDMKGRLQVADDVSFNSKVHIKDDAKLYSNLDVVGNTLISGSLTVDGSLNFRGELSQTDISHNVLISDQLKVHNIADNEVALIVQQDNSESSIAEFKKGDVTKGDVTKVEINNNGDISMNSVLKIMNNTTSNNNIGGTAGALYVKGGTRLDGSLNVMGETYFKGDITFVGEVTSLAENKNAILSVTSDNINNNQFTYDGVPLSTVDKTSKFNINGGANFNDSVVVENFFYGNKINMDGDASFNTDVFINGDISANTNLYLGGDASLNSKLFVSGDVSMNTNLYLGGDASLNSKLFVSGDISANTNLYLGGDVSFNKDLFVSGETKLGTVNNIGVPLYVDGSGAMRIPVGASGERPQNPEIGYIRYNTDDTTFEGWGANNAWGSLGGVSNPAKTTQVYVGDNNEIVFKTDGKIRETIDNTTGDVSINTNLFMNGDISANSNLYLGGDASLNSKLFIGGDISANTNLYLGGDASLNSDLFVSGETKLGTVNNTDVPLYVDGSGAMRIPVGSTSNRPTIIKTGLIRFNTTDETFEGYDGSNWGSLGGVSNADKSSRVYINDVSAIVFETDSIIRETIDNDGNVSFDVANNLGYGKINMKQNSTATVLQVSDSSNNNHVKIQNQGAFKLIYDQSGNENNRIQMNNNEIELLPRYPTRSMLMNHNGAMVGNDYGLSQQLRDKDWKQIGSKNATGTQLGNTVSISRNGKRVAFGEYAVNSADASSNVHIYNVFEREIVHLDTIKITGGNVSSIDLNEDGTSIIIGKYNSVPNGQLEHYKETVGSGYGVASVLQNGSTTDSQLGHTTSINNDGTIFAAGQYNNNSNSIGGIEGGVLIFKYVNESTINKIADISMNNGGAVDQYQQMGRSIELNGAGDRIVIGGTIDKTGSSVYCVYVYQQQADNSWDQVLDISNTSSIGTNFGLSVAMSNDGNVISIATQEDLESIEQYGQVLVYDLLGDGLSSDLTYSMRGSPITFDGIDDGDTFGASMSLNDDGSVLAVGSGALGNFNGKAFIYKYLNSDWTTVANFDGGVGSNMGGIHDYNESSGRLVSDEDGICVDGTGELVIIGAPNLFTADDVDGSGNGQVYLYRNQTYTLGVNKKLRVKGDIVVDDGVIDVSGGGNFSGDLMVAGNVGIGTMNPASNLHISSGISGNCVLTLEADTDNDGSENDTCYINFKQDGGRIWSSIYTTDNALNISNTVNSSGGIIFRTYKGDTPVGDHPEDSDIERMKIESDGNITMANDLSVDGSLQVNGFTQSKGIILNQTEDNGDPIPAIHGNNNVIEPYEIAARSIAGGDGFMRLRAGYHGGTNGSASNVSFIDLCGYKANSAYSNIIRFGTDVVERMRINKVGNVGIGTTDPQAKLDVKGSIRQRSSNNSSGSLLFTDTGSDDRDTTTKFIANAGITIANYTIDNYKNLTSSTTHFQIAGGDNQSQSLIFTAGGSFNESFNSIQSWDTTSSRDYALDLHLQPNGGNVGIGTDSPLDKLHVNGNIRVRNSCIRLQNSGGNMPSNGRIALTKSNASDILGNEINGSIGLNNNELPQRTDMDAGFLRLSAGGGTSLSSKSYIDLYGYQSRSIAFGTYGQERMCINADGNVGIGTYNPTEKLVVKSDNNTDTTVNILTRNTNAANNLSTLNLCGDGNSQYGSGMLYMGASILFGAGIAFMATGNNPNAELADSYISIFRRQNTVQKWTMRNNYSNDDWEFRNNVKINGNINSDNSFAIYSSTNSTNSYGFIELYSTRTTIAGPTITFYTNSTTESYGSEKMRITSTGNVGIGTTNPTAKLEVNGNTVMGTIGNEYDYSNYNNVRLNVVGDIMVGGDFGEGKIISKSNDGTEGIIFGNASPDWFDYNVKDKVKFGTFDEHMRIVGLTGDVGIGTNVPQAKLDVNGTVKVGGALEVSGDLTADNTFISNWGQTTSPETGFYASFSHTAVSSTDADVRQKYALMQSNSGYTYLNSNSFGIDFRNNHVQVGIWDSTKLKCNNNLEVGGNVGIGTTNPTSTLHIHENTGTVPGVMQGSLIITHGNSGGGSSIVFPSNVNDTSDYGYISYRDDLSNDGGENGTLTIGVENDRSDPANREYIELKIGSITGMQMYGLSSTAVIVEIEGTCQAKSFNASSDIRVKTDIEPIEPNKALEQINKLEPKTYKFYDNEETHYGLVAQEAEQIIPESVNSNGTKMIPSICETCKLINDGKTIVLDTKTTTDMVVTKLEFDDLSGNKQSVEIESFEGEKYIHLKESIEKRVKDEQSVFVSGHEVNDFRSINYNTIATANVAATKALTTELNETRTELNETRTELNETRTELNELKKLVERLMNK